MHFHRSFQFCFQLEVMHGSHENYSMQELVRERTILGRPSFIIYSRQIRFAHLPLESMDNLSPL